MEERRPSLRQETRKRYVSDTDGKVRFVESVETSQTYIDEFRIVEDHQTNVRWACEMCGEPVDSYTILLGEKAGITCGCALRLAKDIISQGFWNDRSFDPQTVQKAYLLRNIFRRRRWRRIFAFLSKCFQRE